MLRLLDKDKVPVKGLRVYQDLCVESVLDLDDKTLSFSAPVRNVIGYIKNEAYIETKEDRFVVKEVNKSTDRMVQVVAQLDLEALEGKAFRSFKTTEKTMEEALRLAFVGTGWTIAGCTITKKRTISMTNVSALDILKQAIKTYRAEIKINSKEQTISIYDKIGEDKGVYFTSQLNLKRLTVQTNTYDFYTEIEPYGKDGLSIASVNNGKTYVENHQYSAKKKRLIWKDERYTVPESLKEDAEAKLTDLSRPYSSYSADVIDLSRNSSGKYGMLAYQIGDTITLVDGITDTREKQRIVRIRRYPEEPARDTCTLANKTLTFDELAQKYENAADTVENITNDNGEIDGDAIDSIHSRQVVDLEDAIVQSATIIELNTKYLNVSGKLTAVEGEFGTLKANVAEFEKATVQRLDATEADIHTLKTVDMEAANAKIHVLEAESANIKSLLSGNAGIGDLQNIHLTSQNAVIDSALIRNAVMQTVTVNDLLAGKISTNKFEIASNDGGIRISGATQQWKDKNGVVRMQAGKDAKGDFTFSLFDATGKGVLIDSTGIKPGAIADGLIVNDMVSDNANISGSKLDITSVFEEMNGSTSTLKSNRIWFDDKNQTLNQVYSQMSTDITNAGNTAQKALDAVNGIDTLDAISAVLSNDAHVVHTNTDGSGGDYSDCSTTMTVFSGDVDVSEKAAYTVATSLGVTGTWDAKTRTYKVTGMAAEDGWVDIDALYGTGAVFVTTRAGNKLKSRKGNYLTMRTGGAHIKKRFSISKAPDGRVGTSYQLRADTLVLRKQQDGTLLPKSVLFSAVYNDGQHLNGYAGRFKIEESTDGTIYTQKYLSIKDETSKSYTPSSANLKAIRCTLYASGGVGELDSQNLLLLVDAEGLPEEIKKVQEGMQSVKTEVTNIQTGMEGIKANLSSMETQLHGVTDNTLLYNVQYSDNGNNTVTLTARVYKNGKDVTKEFPERWFTWYAKSETGDKYAGYGYSISVNKNQVGFGTTYIGRFVTHKTRYLTTRTGKRLTTKIGKALTTWVEE